MQQGDVVADRFDIEARVAAGGMGQIFRARDRQNGEFVAVKVLIGDLGGQESRFAHETRALSELPHPHIVRYVAHGALASGEPYLAMEWLEGEDLSRRLERAGLTLEESLTLAKRVAGALGAAHARGIIHRDLKPSNIFLVGGSVDQVKVLDFGIARVGGATRITRTGTIVGTPGYMAPEQVQTDRSVDARADVFSLGCVLFECLTGSPAFAGEHLMALLAKVLFAEPARLREVRPEAPEALEELLICMMAKEPQVRPRDGAAVAHELAALDERWGMRGSMPPRIALTRGERRTISVVLIEAGDAAMTSEDVTLDKADADATRLLREGAATFGGRLEYLQNGAVAVAIGDGGLPTDQATQAARCALWLRANAAGRAVALATGRGEVTGRNAAAEAIDRATKLLFSRDTVDDGAADAIAIDEVTARLLDARFDVRQGEAGYTLHAELELGEGTRTLLGKATPCVGRDAELRLLEQLFDECVDEPGARAMLVTAPAGTGKSRLLQEFLRMVDSREGTVSVWTGRGDPLRAGSAFGLLSPMLRGVCGIREGEPLEVRREKLMARIAERVEPSHRQRVAEFLGELISAPFPDEDSLPLRAARKEAQLMNDQMRGAFLELLRVECEANPVLLVLEDLHWGDRPTVQFVDFALRDLRELPLFVVAMARPEVHELFPKLWSDRAKQEIQLKPLGKKASERLARHVLGGGAQSEVIERLVRLSEGNAFYLEELIRATAESGGNDLPETVVAMVQSRLGALDDGARRILRAASVFGEVFWNGAVACLLGAVERETGIRDKLDELLNRELIVKRKESRFADEKEYAFRHALLREGAYGMLTDEDRALGHRLAGEWLEGMGEEEPAVLAEHFERGGERRRAAVWHAKVALRGLSGYDLQAVLTAVERGLSADPDAETEMVLWGIKTQAAHFADKLEMTLLAAEETMKRAAPGSSWYCRALACGLLGAAIQKQHDMMALYMGRLLTVEPLPDAIAAIANTLAYAVYVLFTARQRDTALLYLNRLRMLEAQSGGHDPLVAAAIARGEASRALSIERNWFLALERTTQAERIYIASGETQYALMVASVQTVLYQNLGAFEDATSLVERVLSQAQPSDMVTRVAIYGRTCIALARGAVDEALDIARFMIGQGPTSEAVSFGYYVKAVAHLLRGDLDAAQAALAAAGGPTGMVALDRWGTLAKAKLALARGEIQGIADMLSQAIDQDRGVGIFEDRHSELLLLRAEALMASGQEAEARAAIREARDDVLHLADQITDPLYRTRFLERIPWNARTLSLAQQWLQDD